MLSAFIAALVGCSPMSGNASGQVIIADAVVADTVDPEPEEACDIHPTEEASDDGCCGCHYYSVPGECLPDCPQPEPVPCTDETGAPAVGCDIIIFNGATTYYRIGSGTEPRAGEYEYEMGQMGDDGKIKRNGGASNRGVSFFDTEAAAKAARDRIPGSTAKIHKVSFFPQADLTFVEKKPPNNHYHLVPNRNNMTLAEYRAALKKVRLTKVEP